MPSHGSKTTAPKRCSLDEAADEAFSMSEDDLDFGSELDDDAEDKDFDLDEKDAEDLEDFNVDDLSDLNLDDDL